MEPDDLIAPFVLPSADDKDDAAHNAPIITELARVFHGVGREGAPFAHPSAKKISQSVSVTPV
ncbi:hypothetical protein [Aerobium aerolatum]|uniref:hypothetical protein n=1 Tax=Aerobium aerolatum TaxID=561088 RepID=UPI000B8A0821|nr:hypothetical protein [Aquamicrobium aerolatum]